MSILDEILNWSNDLEDWKRDALRRLFNKTILDEKDKNDVYAMLKSSHNIADTNNRQPEPLNQDHIPTLHYKSATTLLAIKDLKNVNKIAEGQRIEVSPKGVTIIYGGNGSGKSGYARVLKKACRARDSSESIYPDVTDQISSSKIPEASFEIDSAGNNKTILWKRDAVAPEELSRIALFDSHCARSYLDEKGNVAYRPFYLDLVENLGALLTEFSTRLNDEIKCTTTDTSAFNDLRGETKVGKLIESLCAKTADKEIESRATLSEQELARLKELKTVLAESDPGKKIKELKLSSQRIQGLAEKIGYIPISQKLKTSYSL